ncbi:ABC transporter ATP-binding protein [Carnobacterium gallinarum]|uniref:ABC transporter ATP-binding protein n=1 Tax=Carnobacterium gallinarum TaxID=2749 RepID=UPI000554A0C7|nr:ABC transporter ATP-binding protein [Carnobacterium gallinarum]
MKIEVKHVSKGFKNKKVVKDISFELDSNECMALIGPNGAGKTTLIKMIVGVLETDTGAVYMDGKKMDKQKKWIGYLPQTPQFFQWMTANETLYFMGELSGIFKEILAKEIPLVLEKVGLSDSKHQKIGGFSGGMKQRLGIAQAILHKPAFLVMDEPVSALDPIGRREVLTILEELKKETAIIFSTHILSDASEICERFFMMKAGEMILDSSAEDLLNQQVSNQLLIRFVGYYPELLEKLKAQSWITKVNETPQQWIIEVEELLEHKEEVLRMLIEEHVNLVTFDVKKESLEELFLKEVVGS